ncbi:pyridoxal-dependent decarboxylase domain protein [Drechslerella dactyloides]|uniref:Pyridoxal-dependent decarboxylase domain protein n=1 Tax=Drechslerella dactyloides TaxID=74499 RepID=A0AAD6NJR9_DREDA|nr:pyridoxal-dependent decarboxylase domain protein [Drechslerella dactyloides]
MVAELSPSSLPYHEPSINTILILSSFLFGLNLINWALDISVFCGLVGQILVGIVYGAPVANWITSDVQNTVVQLGYLGLILLVYQGGMHTSLGPLLSNLPLATVVAITGIAAPIALSFLLSPISGATPLQCFSAGAALSATSLGTTFTILSSAGFAGTRLGVVLTGAAMMDDVVGLVMVQVVASLGAEEFTAASAARPIGASVGLVVAAVILGKTGKYLFGKRQLPEAIRGTGTVWALQTLVLVAMVVASGYAGASVLFGAFIAGTLVTWWDEYRATLEVADAARARDTGVSIYEKYYLPAVHAVLIPFFFASIGFSVPVKRMFAGRIVWRGIVYSVLMLFAKLVTGVWLLVADLPFRAVVKSEKLWPRKRNTNKSKEPPKPVEIKETAKDDAADSASLPTPPDSPKEGAAGDEDEITPAPETISQAAKEEHTAPPEKSVPSETKDNKPAISLYPAMILGLAMVARGEIGFLIASIASANGIFTTAVEETGASNDDIFVIVIWAAVICTIVGPLAVGLLVRRVKRLEESYHIIHRIMSKLAENGDVDAYDAIHSYFIGPKGVNMPDFRANINTILDELLEARWQYFPEDNKFISAGVRRSKKFQDNRDDLSNAVRKVAQLLGEHSVPFWSPRYQAHMCTDLTMPSMLGYFMTMLYNPNNVALEASPITTLAELRVGKQLCKLFGYNTDETSTGPVGWGHITCDGTVANLESIWVARNLKFYPLALFRALKDGKLQFIKEEFKVAPCKPGSAEKKFIELDNWELLNLRPETVLDLPVRLNKQFGISSDFLTEAVREYNIQTVGRAPLEEYFGKREQVKPMKYFAAKTRHYSWPKSAAIAGLGSDCIFGIEVDDAARIDLALLEKELRDCAKEKRAVYAVVAIVGTTEEGAVDRLSKIVELRKKLQDELGLSFLIHADAAWGGYFATMLRRPTMEVAGGQLAAMKAQKLVPTLWLKSTTEEDLFALEDADSITVDPHKAGYIPYPAGSLVYRDGRMRHLVTWSSPYLSQGSAENIGVYGVEGSKPGAAAMSTWFSNQTIGLTPEGYGNLLGEAAFTSSMLSAYWATMENDYFVCVPLNMLPSEQDGKNKFDSKPVEDEKQWIRDNILNKDNKEIKKPQRDLLRKLGSDLNINAFTLNWLDEKKRPNKDLEEANYLMKRVVDRLSITSANTDPTHIPMFLTSTKFGPDDYGQSAQTFMERMGIDKCKQSLFVLRNVVMSPFPTQTDFLRNLMKQFQEVVIEEVEVCRRRNRRGNHKIQFLMQGKPTDVFLVLQTSFHSATRRQQLIFTAKLDDQLKDFYKKLQEQAEEDDEETMLILESAKPLDIEEADNRLKANETVDFSAKVYAKGYPKTGNVTLMTVVKSRPLNTANQDSEYPAEFTPFYLYGKEETHLSHMLTRAPNIALSASNPTFEPELPKEVCELLPKGVILTLSVPEASKQPFPMENKLLPDHFFFRRDETFDVKIFEDAKPARSAGPGLLKPLGKQLHECKMTLGKHVVVDAESLNKDRFSRINVDSDSWQKELDKIGNILSGEYRTADDDE